MRPSPNYFGHLFMVRGNAGIRGAQSERVNGENVTNTTPYLRNEGLSATVRQTTGSSGAVADYGRPPAFSYRPSAVHCLQGKN